MSHDFEIGGGDVLRLTCSIGCAGFPFFEPGPSGLSWEQVVTLADRGLYVAKSSGRNRTVYVASTDTTRVETLTSASRAGFSRLIETDQISVRLSEATVEGAPVVADA